MARSRQYPKRVSTAIRLPEDTHCRLVEAAEKRDLSMNWLVCRAVEDFLDRLIPVDQLTVRREPNGLGDDSA